MKITAMNAQKSVHGMPSIRVIRDAQLMAKAYFLLPWLHSLAQWQSAQELRRCHDGPNSHDPRKKTRKKRTT